MIKNLPHTGLDNSLYQSIRTEDVRFSPSGRLLAIVATNGQIFILKIDSNVRPIHIGRCVELGSKSLSLPHGVDFLSEKIIVVANRKGYLTFYRIPEEDTWKAKMMIDPIHELDSEWFGRRGEMRIATDGWRKVACGPGSVRVAGSHIVTSCNYKSTVTTYPYTIDSNDRISTDAGRVLIKEGLEIPDGVAFSRDNQWIAVSEHEYSCVKIFRNAAQPKLLCELRDPKLSHPHGICFDAPGKTLYVADAGERFLHVFKNNNAWSKSMSRSSIKKSGVELSAFSKTKESIEEKFRPLEGGIKGIDLDRSGKIIVTTCQNQFLKFFEIRNSIVDINFSRIFRWLNPFITSRKKEYVG